MWIPKKIIKFLVTKWPHKMRRRWVWKSLEEGFSVGLYGWGVQLLVGFSYNYSFFLSANWLMNLVFAASTKKKKRSGATINYFLSIFCRGSSGLTPCLEDTYSFSINLDLVFLCNDKLNITCGFEIIYLGIDRNVKLTFFEKIQFKWYRL